MGKLESPMLSSLRPDAQALHQPPATRPAGLLRFITAGSVDDGKSTLIGRLLYDSKGLLADQVTALETASKRRGLAQIDLSLLTDGLLAEREQGITIDVAYRYFATPARKFIIGDSPGHVQYTRNMVTAASTADVAVLLVDAQQGIQPQTRRHAYLARWVGIRRIVLAVNKMDLVGWSERRFAQICAEFRQFADTLDFVDTQPIPMSALSGDMVVERGNALDWYHGPALLQYLETVPSRRVDAGGSALRFPVQRVTRVTARNAQQRWTGRELRGYQGTVSSGSISVGDELVVLPAGLPARVAGIVTADGAQSVAFADEAVTILLDRELDIARGDIFAPSVAPPRVTHELEAEVCWFDTDALQPSRTYLVKHGTQLVKARFSQLGTRLDIATLTAGDQATSVALNDIVKVRMQLKRPLAVDPYGSNRVTGAFIVIDDLTNRTVAAGTIA